jgi:hypothetical protein
VQQQNSIQQDLEKRMALRTPEEVYEDLHRLDACSKTVRLVKSNVLLAQVESLWKLLHTSNNEIWKGARTHRPSLPVFKTVTKALTTPAKPLGRSATIRLLRFCPATLIEEAFRSSERDYIWPTGIAWIGVFNSGYFQNDKSKRFWVQFVRDAEELNAKTLRSDEGLEDNWCRYICSSVALRFGCAELWQTGALDKLQHKHKVASLETVTSRLLHADAITVLLRILAWYVADAVVESFWDVVEREEMSEITPFESILPTYDEGKGVWSNPMLSALEHLGSLCEWKKKQKVTTYLGNRWASASRSEAADRIKLLRSWVQVKKGRPKFQKFLDLVRAVTEDTPRLKNTRSDERDSDTWIQASVLRLGETLALLRTHLSHLGFTNDSVSSIMAVYADEYRYARSALGRPMSARQ